MTKPPATAGMRHVALNVSDVQTCEQFYVDLLGMEVEWRPDEDNVYLSSGNDNLALHRCQHAPEGRQSLDHIGFILKNPHMWMHGMNF
jgi:catechol 2,3-dioxygenase-like lactoylglutathione lyase family enzyme